MSSESENSAEGKYGNLKVKDHLLKKPAKKYFDSGDWMLQKQSKPLPDDAALYSPAPADSMPVRKDPFTFVPREKTPLFTCASETHEVSTLDI
mmetsp:Transcript_22889/g.40459  ORF Transcript_22889/g.40459 Transcript_22889/m.40459 type:complete len:93 (-) Transcript_22889:180-458(-)